MVYLIDCLRVQILPKNYDFYLYSNSREHLSSETYINKTGRYRNEIPL